MTANHLSIDQYIAFIETESNHRLLRNVTHELASKLISMLNQKPFWLILKTDKPMVPFNAIYNILIAMSIYNRPFMVNPPHISKTKVQINPGQSSEEGQITRYSRTPYALPLHTDCSNNILPQNVVVFAMEQPDPQGGGKSILLSANDLANDLPDDLINSLNKPLFPFTQKNYYPIFQGYRGNLKVRYYRRQIDLAMKAGATIHPLQKDAIDKLDYRLNTNNRSVQLELNAGEILIMNNHRVLHGRSSMDKDSPRLLHRYRLC